MRHKRNIIFIFLSFLLCNCTYSHANKKNNQLPVRSFVKILSTIEIIECKKKSTKCRPGVFAHSGSGMAIEIKSLKDQMTVITAGHVCSSLNYAEIKHSIETVQVLDHKNNLHQAWPIKISFDNQKDKADLCALWVPTLNVKKIKISHKGPSVGDELFYIGAPVGVYHPPTAPIFKGIYSGTISPTSAITTFPAIGGSSGAAVLNSQHKIVGIVFAANIQFHHISLITSHDKFIDFLNEIQ